MALGYLLALIPCLGIFAGLVAGITGFLRKPSAEWLLLLGLPALMLFETVHAADHRRFSGARRPANDNPFAFRHRKIDVPQDVELAVPFVDVAQFDDRFRFRHGTP